MALVSCKLCGKVFGSTGSKVCPACMKRLEEVYADALHYLRSNDDENIDAKHLADNIGDDVRDIQELVNMGWIDLKDENENDTKRRRKRAQEFSDELDKMRGRKKQTFYGGEIYARKHIVRTE